MSTEKICTNFRRKRLLYYCFFLVQNRRQRVARDFLTGVFMKKKIKTSRKRLKKVSCVPVYSVSSILTHTKKKNCVTRWVFEGVGKTHRRWVFAGRVRGTMRFNYAKRFGGFVILSYLWATEKTPCRIYTFTIRGWVSRSFRIFNK